MSEPRKLFTVNQITSYDTEIGAIAEKRISSSVMHFKTALETVVYIKSYNYENKYHKFIVSETTVKDFGVYTNNIEYSELIEESRKELNLFADKVIPVSAV